MNVILNRVTIDDVLSLGPCGEYNNRATLEALFAGRKSLDALEILDVNIPVSDRFWAVLREEVLPAPILHEVACRYAEQSIRFIEKLGLSADPRSLAAMEAKRKWNAGQITDEQLSAARSAAESAAWSAAESAAMYAARSAAESAARSAAESVAESAAESAAMYAAESAAWSARSAAESAARSAAESVAESAAWSARSAARYAAWSARSAARSAAESAAWLAALEEQIKILKDLILEK